MAVLPVQSATYNFCFRSAESAKMSMSQAWKDLPLSKPVMTTVLKHLKYKMMTPVQVGSIP